MSNWYKRMKPSLVNWRWWAALPIVIAWLSALVPFILFEALTGCLSDFARAINIADKPAPEIAKKLFKWIDNGEER